MSPADRHHRLVSIGVALHERRRYAGALAKFRLARRHAPECPVVAYNLANTLHMLDQDEEAFLILRDLVKAEPEVLTNRCEAVNGRSLQLDAFYLLFLVSVHGQGFSEAAFRYAEEHLRRRRRGLRSAWSAREVRGQIAAFRKEWAT